MPTRNSEALASFVAYCQAHPQERFWQALRNWSKWHFIFGADSLTDGHLYDTFNVEGLEGTRQ